MFLLIFICQTPKAETERFAGKKNSRFWEAQSRLWTSRTANQASPNSMVIPVGINAWSAGSQDLRMMSSNHSEIYGHWACRRQRNVGSCFVGKKYGDFPMSRPTNMFVWICVLEGYAWWTWPNYTMVVGPFAKWLMESQKAKIMSVIRCFFPSLVFIVTSKNLKKDGRTEHLQSLRMQNMAVLLTEGFDLFHAQRIFEPPANHW